ncbi:MAG TPA: formimidoylglutamase [Edaphocola sp.]|nr:formimidoylglutamase [Edaphocola sp.]
MFQFRVISKEEKDNYLNIRPGETHIGEMITCASSEDEMEDLLQSETVRFVLVGLPEDIGVRANGGIGGAQTGWQPFLRAFLNIQETEFLSGRHFLLYGHLHNRLTPGSDAPADPETLRAATAGIDELVFPHIQKIVAAGKIPVVIGGGHNNAYPLLKGASLALKQPLNAINTDAHADFRAIEGRHSGNGFSYAFTEGYLKNYFALGLHEAYNNREMMQAMAAADGIDSIYWEDIFMRRKMSWEKAIEKALSHVSESFFGTELDTDSIAHTLSSAETPVGITEREAMRVLYACGQSPQAVYMHLPEAVARRADGQTNPLAGKLLSYLVQAFCKGVLER